MFVFTTKGLVVCLCYLAVILQAEAKPRHRRRVADINANINVSDRGKRAFDRSACPQKYLDENNNHTMCLVDVGTAGPTLSNADKNAIVDLHNEFRMNVQPPATNMLKVIWDDDIAVVAAKWARQCIDDMHDDDDARSVPELPGVHIGQNLGAGYSSLTAAITAWHAEVNQFTFGVGGTKIGHYTQVVSETVARIGCGSANCSNSIFKKIHICNYAVGQMDTKKPYQNGTSCANCQQCVSNKLCDCGGKLCYNGGKLDPNTCTCTCPSMYYSGDLCQTSSCPSQVSKSCASYDDDACTKFTNVPSDCPLMCGKCGTLPCGGKICRNWGELDVATCTCQCQPTYTGDTCKTLDCSLSDPSFCSYYSAAYCLYTNIKFGCPHMCSLC
ncbi:cysteine-rich venom protein Mr30-like [Gigantopelta aegis]|uniref:cysteine-rich venom protein Mr30-like n=1 Tax=Gigantopelta aegis TaxID=1735272 RepID=UPI001B889407|nr:cysteine-rich venom protein Mr30-like [Gigantopelta aegis]